MPDMDGLDATRRIRSEPDLAGIVVIAVSGYAYPEDREKALAAGCDAWMTKPYELATLLNVINQATKGLNLRIEPA
jgi:two-component system cell cycle response regulator DivK